MAIVFNISYKLLASGQLKDHVPGVPKCEDGEEESEKEQSQNIYKAGGFHLMGIGADGHGGRGARAILSFKPYTNCVECRMCMECRTCRTRFI